MKQIVTLIFAMTYLCMSSLSAKALHLLILADTGDQRIGGYVAQDVDNMEQCFSYLATVSKIPLHTTKLTTTKQTLTRNRIMRCTKKNHLL